MSRYATVATLALLLAGRASAGGPPNDDCANAEPITGTGLFHFDNSGASTDGPLACAPVPFGPNSGALNTDVWFCWTAPAHGSVTVDTCGGTTVDTKIEVYQGCDCSFPFASRECADSNCGMQSLVTLDVSRGQSYLVRIGTSPVPGNVDGGQGNFAIVYGEEDEASCDQPPEHCQTQSQDNALGSDGRTFTVADNFTPAETGAISEICWWGAYRDDQGPCLPDEPDAFEVRYYLDAGGKPGPLIAGPFTSLGPSLFIERAHPARRIAGETRELEYAAAHDPVVVVAGECYWIEITNDLAGNCAWYWETSLHGDERAVQDGTHGAGADGYDPTDAITEDLAFCLDIPLTETASCLTPPSNDECQTALPIFDGETFFDTTGATDNPLWASPVGSPPPCCDFPLGDEQVHGDIWFDYVATCTGRLSIQSCNTAYDAKIAVYVGADCILPDREQPIACNDDACSNDPALLPPPGGAAGLAGDSNCLETRSSEVGCDTWECELRVCAVRPECCETQWHVGCANLAAETCTHLSSDCLWPRLEPGCEDETCTARVCASAPHCCESAWYPECAREAAVLCLETRQPGLQPELSLQVTEGKSYKIRVGGYRGASGPGTLRLGVEPAAPASVDLRDYALFASCLTPRCPKEGCDAPIYESPCCGSYDLDIDGDIDPDDFAGLSTILNGPYPFRFATCDLFNSPD